MYFQKRLKTRNINPSSCQRAGGGLHPGLKHATEFKSFSAFVLGFVQNRRQKINHVLTCNSLGLPQIKSAYCSAPEYTVLNMYAMSYHRCINVFLIRLYWYNAASTGYFKDG